MPKLSEQDLADLSEVEKKIYEQYLESDQFRSISFEAFLHRTAISILMKRSDEMDEKLEEIDEKMAKVAKILTGFDTAIDQLKNNSMAVIGVLVQKGFIAQVNETDNAVMFEIVHDDKKH